MSGGFNDYEPDKNNDDEFDEPSTYRDKKSKHNDTASIAESDLNVFANPERKLDAVNDESSDADTEDEPPIKRGGKYSNKSRYSRQKRQSRSRSRSSSESSSATASTSGESEATSGDFEEAQRPFMEMPSPRRLSYKQKIQLKAQLLARLERKQRFSGRTFEISKDATLKDLQLLNEKVSYETRALQAVKTYQRILVMVVGFYEGICKRFPILGVTSDIDGYAEHVFLTIEQFDEDFYDLYDLWGAKRRGHPLARILLSVVTGSVQYSMARRMMHNSGVGGDPMMPSPMTPDNRQRYQQQRQSKPQETKDSHDNLSTPVNKLNMNQPQQLYKQSVQFDTRSSYVHQSTGLDTIPEEYSDGGDDEFGEMVGPPEHMIQKLRAEEDRLREERGETMPVDATVAGLMEEPETPRQSPPRSDRESRELPAVQTKRRSQRKKKASTTVPIKSDETYKQDETVVSLD